MRKVDSKFILNESIPKVLMTVSIPLIINNLIMTIYNLADGLWVAQLSSTQFAATSFTWPVHYLFISLALGVSIAGTSIIARYIGAKRNDDASKYANHVVFMLAIIGVLFSVVGYFITPYVVDWMGAKGDLNTYAKTYLQINLAGFIFDSMYFAFQAILNAQGGTKYTTAISGISGVINILLDPFLIFETIPILGFKGLGLGIGGAALATVISKVFAMIMGVFLLNKKSPEVRVSLRNFLFENKIAKTILKTGLPTAIGQGSAAFGFTILNTFIVSFGTATVAGFSMVNRITDLLMQPIAGISGGITSIIAQNLGAKQVDRAKETFFTALKYMSIFSIIGAVFVKVFDVQLINFFIGEEDGSAVINEALEYMKYAVFTIPLMGGFNIFAGLFQGTGQMKFSMYMSIIRLWLVRIPLVLFFKQFTDLGSEGVWIAMIISNILVIILGTLYYKKIDWSRDL